jgi:hypothetical protein
VNTQKFKRENDRGIGEKVETLKNASVSVRILANREAADCVAAVTWQSEVKVDGAGEAGRQVSGLIRAARGTCPLQGAAAGKRRL